MYLCTVCQYTNVCVTRDGSKHKCAHVNECLFISRRNYSVFVQQHTTLEQSKERHKQPHALLKPVKSSAVFPDCSSVVAVNSAPAWFSKADYLGTKCLHKNGEGSLFASLIACNHKLASDKYAVSQQKQLLIYLGFVKHLQLQMSHIYH